MFISVEEQMKIILKGVEEVISADNLKEKLELSIKEDRPLIIKLGLDPSAPDIHLGHAVVLRKIKQMQDLGHKAVIIIGDFTGKIGDPTGKSKGRVALSDEQVKANALTYQTQICKVLDMDKTEVRYNGDWLSKLNFEDVIRLAATTTVARILEREDFKNRYNNNVPIGLHEFFYPLMQAYDSVEIDADIELGGTDQTFNILMGRTLQKHLEKPVQVALFMPILEGLDGVEKMSKSLGNYIGVDEDANIMFKKVMEIPDSLIIKFFNLTTDIHPDVIHNLEQQLENGANPRDIKLLLAKEITSLYHSKDDVQNAIVFYQQAFSKKVIPDDVPTLVVDATEESVAFIDMMKLFVENQYATSSSELRRLLSQGGISCNGDKINDINALLHNEDVLKFGKKRFVKLVFNK